MGEPEFINMGRRKPFSPYQKAFQPVKDRLLPIHHLVKETGSQPYNTNTIILEDSPKRFHIKELFLSGHIDTGTV
ncbi:hypothetical protein THIOM_005221 [Candidatus Thiomargarita nelsonii]|uniref:Uncharacterized protein n=1 Tax=Candidatus Thiomargarita nelsonii TaxID=1003181 RepID=A0A176RTV1_9GAMM|nr:hypothetical protein THIOM_005221 [Candidatus Thiomargarita nelsonii]